MLLTIPLAGVNEKMSFLCQLLLTLTVLLIPTRARLDGIRIFLNASDLNERFEGTGHTFACELDSIMGICNLNAIFSISNMS